jgi:hypothetical protein
LPLFGNEQPGETYYFSPLTINIFGVADTDKDNHTLTAYCYAEVVGNKGGNNVTSLLMKHLDDTYGLKETDPIKEPNILLDNCPGKNKNRMVLWLSVYLVELGFFSPSISCYMSLETPKIRVIVCSTWKRCPSEGIISLVWRNSWNIAVVIHSDSKRNVLRRFSLIMTHYSIRFMLH